MVTSEAFCSNGMRDRKEQNSAITVFLFKSFSLKTLIAFVSLFRKTVTNIARDTVAMWTGKKQTIRGNL